MREVAEEFAREAEERGYRLDLDGPLPPVRADREAFGRALWNLLDNAVKYSPQCRTVWLAAAREGEQLAVRVRDRGLGIAPEEQPQVFQKFVRGASARATEAKGTGWALRWCSTSSRRARALRERGRAGNHFHDLVAEGEGMTIAFLNDSWRAGDVP